MVPSRKPADYHAGCNQALLRAVPGSARRVLDVGCGEGRLGALLKLMAPGREVFGVELDPDAAGRAARQLDRVFTLDVEEADLPLEPGSVDCILYGDVLEHLAAPEAVLRRHRKLLGPQGQILCSVPNVQHHTILSALLRGDFQYTSSGLLDTTHLRFYTWSTFFKLLLDAGFAPRIVGETPLPCPEPLFAAAQPLLRLLNLHPERTGRYLGAYQYLVEGTPLPDEDTDAETPLTFAVCVSDEAVFRANLLSSPCLRGPSPHQVIPVQGCRSAAEGLNQGIAQARHELVVGVHQDVYLPAGWPARFLRQYRQAVARLGRVGVAGVYGVALREGGVRRAGFVVDRDRLLRESAALPAEVDTLDEIVLAVPRDTPLRFDPGLGFHFYGADVCLAARERGLPAVVLDALCFHNSASLGLPESFFPSAAAFAAKWRGRLPVATSCVVVDRDGTMRTT